MAKYLAEIYHTTRYWVPIEAEDLDKAIDKAEVLTLEQIMTAPRDLCFDAFDLEEVIEDA